MNKTPLIERMQKGGAAKAWIKEVEAKDREIFDLEQIKVQYLSIINLLAFEKEQLEAMVQAAVDYFEDGITSKEQYDAYLRFVDVVQPFFDATGE